MEMTASGKRVGILVEKPSAARHFAAALGGMSGRFDDVEYVIAHARGHLFEFVDPHRMVTDPALVERYQKWNLANLPWDPADFSWEIEPIEGTGDVARQVTQTLAGCDEIVIATDVDPSGEGGMIAVNAFLQLGLQPHMFSRMYFTDEAPVSLQKAFAARTVIPSLGEFDEYKKAVFRSKFDFLSMQWTRCATSLARATGRDVVLRQGRLKSAMVALVGDQMKAHLVYRKQPFFQNRFRDENGVLYTDPDEQRFDDATQVPSQYTASRVVCDSRTTKRTPPPKLLDLAALSALLAGAGVPAKNVLDTYQRMYEAQVVSYPRTEDKTITPEQFAELAPHIDRIAAVVDVDLSLLTQRGPRPTHVKVQGAHGANRPGPNVPSSLEEVTDRFGQTGRKIYEILAKNYLAMIADDYIYEQQKGHVHSHPTFVGISNVPKTAGWKAVFDPDAGAEPDAGVGEDSEEAGSGLGLGETAEPFVFEGANKRPEHPSMRWLMKQLEKRDVGTGATRTSTYADVTNAATTHPLLVEAGRKLTLADAGLVSWQLLAGTRIGDLTLTERIYTDMREIAAGTGATAEARLAVVAEWVREDIETMTRNAAALGRAEGAPEPKERVTGMWGAREVTFLREWGGHRFTDAEVQQLLAGDTIEFTAVNQKGVTFDVFGALANQEFKGRAFVGFVRQGFARRGADGAVLPPKQWCSHIFTEKEVQQLLAGGAVEAKDFVSKNGKRFHCTVTFQEEKKGEGKKIVPSFA